MSASIVCLFFLLASGLTYAVADDGIYFGTPALAKPKCVYNIVFKMVQAKCANLHLEKIPPTLRTDTQVLDISGNRLRDLKNDTFSSFTSLSYLYLMDNFFTEIEDATFVYLRKLQVLDLSKNALYDIPENIFALPMLNKLFISDNKIDDRAMGPIPFAEQSTLELFDISNNHLSQPPRLGSLPHLKVLNLSRNSIKELRSEDIAVFCSLQVLDVSNNPISFPDHCDCKYLNAWVADHKIKMIPPKFNCTDEKRPDSVKLPWCTHQSIKDLFTNETLRRFENCRNVLKIQEQTIKARSTWILVASCVAAFLVCLFIILYCIHRRNKNKKSVSVKRDLVINHGDNELLKGNNVTEPVE